MPDGSQPTSALPPGAIEPLAELPSTMRGSEEAEEEARWNGSDHMLAYEDFDLRRWEQFAPYREGELYFTPYAP